jgi:putative exosortase-associated protein (TIGR04073 family)
MKSRLTRITLLIFLALSLGGVHPPALYAQEAADYGVGVSTKFGRGLVNVLSSPLEIPCTIRDEVSERGAVGVATGLGLGIAYFARRVLVGVTEVGTFMIPMEATIPAVCAKKPEAQLE